MSTTGHYIEQYLKMLDHSYRSMNIKTPSGYSSVAGLVLDRGCEMRVSRSRPSLCGKMGECFMNAQRLASLAPEKYRYAEGYAVLIPSPLPIVHSWCLTRRGLVVDPTWYGRGKATYYGLQISLEYVLERQLATGTFHGMIDDWEYGSKLFMTPGLVEKVTTKCRQRKKPL